MVLVKSHLSTKVTSIGTNRMPMALEEPYGVVLLQIVVLVKNHLSTKVTSIGTKRMPMALEEPYGVVLLQTVVLVKVICQQK